MDSVVYMGGKSGNGGGGGEGAILEIVFSSIEK
jgi:hypothetical protein